MEEYPAAEEEQSNDRPSFRITDVYLTDQGQAGGTERLQMSLWGLPTRFSSSSSRRLQSNPRRHKSTSSLHHDSSLNLCAAVPNSSLEEPPPDTLQVSRERDFASLEIDDDDVARVSTDEAIPCADEEVLASDTTGLRDPQKGISFSEVELTERRNVIDDLVAPNEGAGCAEMDAAFQAAMVSCSGMLAPGTYQQTRIATDELVMTTGNELISVSGMLTDEGDSGGMVTGEGPRAPNVAEGGAPAVSNAQALASKNGAMAAEQLPTVSDAKAVSESEETMSLDSPASHLVHELPNEATVATYNFPSCEGINASAMVLSEQVLVEVAETSAQELPFEDSQNPSTEVSRWMPIWDSFYSCYYFYNTDTLETTWQPPTGFEMYTDTRVVEESQVLQQGVVCGTSNSREPVVGETIDRGLSQSQISGLSTAKEDSGNGEDLGSTEKKMDHDEIDALVPQKVAIACAEENVAACASPVTQETLNEARASIDCDVIVQVASGNVRTRTRRVKKASSLLLRSESDRMMFDAAMVDHSPAVFKYWVQRYYLFSKYDLGIQLDEEGWFSVTPEAIAKHQAARCNRGVIVDAFTGMGGNAIQFARAGHHVVAIDNNPKKIEFAHHNAGVYGVADRIDFVLGDFFAISPSLQADVIFLSPPWGGPDYLDVEVYDILTMLQPKDGMTLFKVAQTVAPNIILFLPRNVNMIQLADLQQASKSLCPCEVERNFLNGKLKAVTAYYGQFTCTDTTHLTTVV